MQINIKEIIIEAGILPVVGGLGLVGVAAAGGTLAAKKLGEVKPIHKELPTNYDDDDKADRATQLASGFKKAFE